MRCMMVHPSVTPTSISVPAKRHKSGLSECVPCNTTFYTGWNHATSNYCVLEKKAPHSPLEAGGVTLSFGSPKLRPWQPFSSMHMARSQGGASHHAPTPAAGASAQPHAHTHCGTPVSVVRVPLCLGSCAQARGDTSRPTPGDANANWNALYHTALLDSALRPVQF